MLFRTQPQFEFEFPLPKELFGENSGVRHWHAFEWVFDDFSFLIEYLVEVGESEDRLRSWKQASCARVQHALQRVAADYVLEHRINLMIPAYATPNQQIQIKPVIEIFTGSDGSSEIVTSDGERYILSLNGEKELLDKQQVYSKANIDVRQEAMG